MKKSKSIWGIIVAATVVALLVIGGTDDVEGSTTPEVSMASGGVELRYELDLDSSAERRLKRTASEIEHRLDHTPGLDFTVEVDPEDQSIDIRFERAEDLRIIDSDFRAFFPQFTSEEFNSKAIRFQYDPGYLQAVKQHALEENVSILQARLKDFGAVISLEDDEKILAQIPNDPDIDRDQQKRRAARIHELIETNGSLSLGWIDQTSGDEKRLEETAGDLSRYVDAVELNGAETSAPTLVVQLDREGTNVLARYTEQPSEGRLGVIIDGTIKSIVPLDEPIRDGGVSFSTATKERAEVLTIVLQHSTRPGTLNLVSETNREADPVGD
jgi:preprotein translocase subunit SecD